MEVLTGFFITIILCITGIGIIYESYQTFLAPNLVLLSYITIGIMVLSAIVNAIMAKVKIYYGKQEYSLSLISDGFHSKFDVYTSVAILFGLILSHYWIYADSLLALFIGIYIIKEAFSLGKEAIDSLLDTSAGDEIEQKIKAILKEQNVHLADLKTQKKGAIITANLEINLPNELSVETATDLSTKLRETLMINVEKLKYVAIQIKSHNVTTSFYKHSLKEGFGWSRRGQFKGDIEGAKGMGPGDYCICPKCGYTVEHKRGIPCKTLNCPTCDLQLTRKVKDLHTGD
jgi:cation diffusion facilitator family transporter